MSKQLHSSIRERVSVVVSIAIIIATVSYWIFQIRGVVEMLKLAYG